FWFLWDREPYRRALKTVIILNVLCQILLKGPCPCLGSATSTFFTLGALWRDRSRDDPPPYVRPPACQPLRKRRPVKNRPAQDVRCCANNPLHIARELHRFAQVIELLFQPQCGENPLDLCRIHPAWHH